MKIKIKGLKEGEHFFLFRKILDSFSARNTLFKDEIEVKVSIDKRGLNYYVKLLINTKANTVCDRCLNGFKIPVEAEFFIIYTEDSNLTKGGETEDLRFLPRDRENINIIDDVMESLVLTQPMKILCREDCKGLCSGCGINLNNNKCNCENLDYDPRWNKLKELL